MLRAATIAAGEDLERAQAALLLAMHCGMHYFALLALQLARTAGTAASRAAF